MSTFPFDAVIEIFMRLPVESLIRFKRLSKQCCGLIESSYFINLHKHHSTNTRSNLSLLCTKHVFGGFKPNIYEVDLPSIEYCEVDLNFRSKHEFPNCYHEYSSSYRVFGECNGLIAFCDKARGVEVWNPATKQHRELPSFWEHYSYGWDSCYGYGFGYDVIRDEYKLVWTAWKCSGNGLEVIVYSLKNNSTTTRDCSFGNIGAGRGVHVGGYLHWVAEDNMIVGLEVRDESIGVVPVPDEWTKYLRKQSLGVVDGLLTVSCRRRIDSGFDIWIMKEYGIKNSWTKLCSIKKFVYLYKQHRLQVLGIKPLCYSKTGNKVLLEINGYPFLCLGKHMLFCLFWYDLQLKSFEKVRICDEEHAVIDFFTNYFVRTVVPLP